MTLHFPLHTVSLFRSKPVKAAMRSFHIIEEDGLVNSLLYLMQAGKRLPVKEFVLDGAVDALSHCIVLWITAFSHAGYDLVAHKLRGQSDGSMCRRSLLEVYPGPSSGP